MLDHVRTPGPARRGPLHGGPTLVETGGATLEILPALDRAVLRGPAPMLGLALSASVGSVEEQDGVVALRLGPDEVLLLSAPGNAALASVCRTEGAYSAVGVGHRQTGLRVTGNGAAALLNTGCPLDLHPSVFLPGTCARTVLGKAEIVLWRRGADEFHLDVARSFAAYAWALLQEAAPGLWPRTAPTSVR